MKDTDGHVLCSISEIARWYGDELGWTEPKVMAGYMSRKPTFPAPLDTLVCGRIWDAGEVVKWFEDYLRTRAMGE